MDPKMHDLPWAEKLRRAANHAVPSPVSGGLAHLRDPIRIPLRAVWEKKLFVEPQRARVTISPEQCHVRCEAGPLLDEIQILVNWNESDVIVHTLLTLDQQIRDPLAPRRLRRFADPTFGISGFIEAIYYGRTAVLAIRTRDGLWCQSYISGWPVVPPFLARNGGVQTGFMLAVSLKPEYFIGLPFTVEDVQQSIPGPARPHVQVVWQPQNILIPPGAAGIESLLDLDTLESML